MRFAGPDVAAKVPGFASPDLADSSQAARSLSMVGHESLSLPPAWRLRRLPRRCASELQFAHSNRWAFNMALHNNSLERTRSSGALQAPISFWAFRSPPLLAAQL